MTRGSKVNLRLGSNVVELLLPQRRPFLMVDAVESFTAEPVPTLFASRYISANEVFFEGHFPGLHVWPGSLTIEGLGQTAILLMQLVGMRQILQAEGADPDMAFEALRNLDRGFRLDPAHRPERVPELLERLRTARPRLAVGAAVNMKFPRPVFAGARLDYRVAWTDDLGDLVRFDTEASVGGAPVATGVLTGAWITRLVIPDR